MPPATAPAVQPTTPPPAAPSVAAPSVAAPSVAAPAETSSTAAPTEPELADLSLTVSPLLALAQVFEVSAELRLGQSLGVSVFGGVGRVVVEIDDRKEELAAYRLGGVLAAYPLEPFESLHFGAEAIWLRVSTDEHQGSRIEGVATGVAVGPVIGYKSIAESGFTFVIQGGIAYLASDAEAELEGDRETASDEQWVPLLNLNLGWSF